MQRAIVIGAAIIASSVSLLVAAAYAYFELQAYGLVVICVAGLVLCALDLIKINAPSLIASRIKARAWGQVVAGFVLFSVFVTGSLVMSFTVLNDHIFGKGAAAIDADKANLGSWKKQIKEAEERRSKLEAAGPYPLEGVAKADLDVHKAKHAWAMEATSSCERPTRDTRSICVEYKRLEAQLAGASGMTDVERVLAELRGKVEGKTSAATVASAPRGLDALMQLAGYEAEKDEGSVSLAGAQKALMLAVTFELVSNLLIFFVLGSGGGRRDERQGAAPQTLPQARLNLGAASNDADPAPPSGPSGAPPKKSRGTSSRGTPRTPAPKAVKRGLGQGGSNVVPLRNYDGAPPSKSVADFVATMPPDPDRFHLSADVGAAYGAWCAGQGSDAPDDLTEFFVGLQALGFRKHKRNGARGYIDERHVLAESA